MSTTDLVVVGGGLVGLLVAHLALRENFTVALIDLEAPPLAWTDEYGLRVSSINRKTVDCFKELGFWESIQAERVSPYRKMHVWDALSGGAIHFDADDVGESCLGFIVENRLMQREQALRLKSYQRGGQLTTYFGDTIQSMHRADEHWVLQLQSGLSIMGSMLVAADGAESSLRERLEFKTTQMHYGQQALVAMVRIERPHQETAYQVFLPTGPLALLPLIDAHRCSIVWSMDPSQAKTFMQDSEQAFNTAIQQAFGDRLGQIELCSVRAHFPLIARHAEAYVIEGAALVGDAAHTIHPLAGQGLNLGVQDAMSLVQTLAWAKERNRPIWSLGTLKRYERNRMGQNQLMLWAMQGFNGLFSNDSPILTGLRGWGLNRVDNFPLVKETFIQIASGKCL